MILTESSNAGIATTTGNQKDQNSTPQTTTTNQLTTTQHFNIATNDTETEPSATASQIDSPDYKINKTTHRDNQLSRQRKVTGMKSHWVVNSTMATTIQTTSVLIILYGYNNDTKLFPRNSTRKLDWKWLHRRTWSYGYHNIRTLVYDGHYKNNGLDLAGFRSLL